MTILEGSDLHRSRRGRKVDAVCWFLFFAWVCFMIFVRTMPAGMGALGVGTIVLGGAAARLLLGSTVTTFWIIIGSAFFLAGVGEMLGIDLPFLPFALLVCGVLLLFHRRSGRRRA